MKFVKIAADSQSSARCGIITTDHGRKFDTLESEKS